MEMNFNSGCYWWEVSLILKDYLNYSKWKYFIKSISKQIYGWISQNLLTLNLNSKMLGKKKPAVASAPRVIKSQSRKAVDTS